MIDKIADDVSIRDCRMEVVEGAARVEGQGDIVLGEIDR
jgi:hypothetical protein